MIQTINISLIPSDNKPVINVSQFDNISRVLRFNVFDDAQMEVHHIFNDGDTVLLNIRKNDNNIVVITGVIVSVTEPEAEQYLTFELTEQACACVGSNYGEVSITNGDDEVIGSCNFKLVVERSPLAGGVDSQSEIDNLTTQIESIAEQVIGENYYDKEEIDNKFDDLDIPTKTSELTNDSGFINSTELNNVLSNYALWPTDQTTKNAIANFETSLTKPMEFKAYIEAVQEAGTPTPQSPKAISGVSAVNVIKCGKNLFNSDLIALGTYTNGVWSIPTGTSAKCYNGIFKANTVYTISGYEKQRNANKNARLQIVYTDGTVVSIFSDFTTDGQTFSYTTTSGKSVDYIKFNYYASNSGVDISNFQIELGSNKTDYVAYNGNTTTIQLGQTVYDGYVEQDKEGHRRLVVTHKKIALNGSEKWEAYATKNGYSLYLSDAVQNMYMYQGLCNWLDVKTSATWSNTDMGIGFGLANARLYAVYVNGLDSITDLVSWKTYLSTHNLEVKYPLATPIVIDLPDGTPINTLSGVNNVYADSGDIEVSYKCTIEEYVNNRLTSTRTLNRAVTLEERSIEENLSETRDIRGYDNEE